MAARDPRMNADTNSLGEFPEVVGATLDESLLPETGDEETYTPLAMRAIEMANKARERAARSLVDESITEISEPETIIAQSDVVIISKFSFDPGSGRSVIGTEVVVGDRSVFVAHRNFTEAQIEDAIQRAEEDLRNGGGHQQH